MSAESTNETPGGLRSPALPGSAWISVADHPTAFTRVIAKNEDEEIADAFWLDAPQPGFYVAVNGGAKRWAYATHYIPWPNDPEHTPPRKTTTDEA